MKKQNNDASRVVIHGVRVLFCVIDNTIINRIAQICRVILQKNEIFFLLILDETKYYATLLVFVDNQLLESVADVPSYYWQTAPLNDW